MQKLDLSTLHRFSYVNAEFCNRGARKVDFSLCQIDMEQSNGQEHWTGSLTAEFRFALPLAYSTVWYRSITSPSFSFIICKIHSIDRPCESERWVGMAWGLLWGEQWNPHSSSNQQQPRKKLPDTDNFLFPILEFSKLICSQSLYWLTQSTFGSLRSLYIWSSQWHNTWVSFLALVLYFRISQLIVYIVTIGWLWQSGKV